MKKERLEKIKSNIGYNQFGNRIVLPREDYNWLIEQAEQLNGTKYRHGFKEMYALCNKDYAILHAQNQRYKRALEFYKKNEEK